MMPRSTPGRARPCARQVVASPRPEARDRRHGQRAPRPAIAAREHRVRAVARQEREARQGGTLAPGGCGDPLPRPHRMTQRRGAGAALAGRGPRHPDRAASRPQVRRQHAPALATRLRRPRSPGAGRGRGDCRSHGRFSARGAGGRVRQGAGASGEWTGMDGWRSDWPPGLEEAIRALPGASGFSEERTRGFALSIASAAAFGRNADHPHATEAC